MKTNNPKQYLQQKNLKVNDKPEAPVRCKILQFQPTNREAIVSQNI